MENDFDKGLREAHSYKSYKAHFASVYRGAQFIKVVLLLISCMFSAFFFAGYLSMFGECAIYAGFIASALLAMIIGVTTGKVLVYWSWQKTVEPLLGLVLALSIGLNIYADLNGAETLGEELAGIAPTDSKTSELKGIYEPQIASIDTEINSIEEKNFYWCSTHRRAHKCEFANHYIDPKKDRLAVAQIAKLKAQKSELVSTMNELLKSNGTQYAEALSTHSVKVTQSKSRMRFGSIVCTMFYLLFSVWAHNYGLRAISETQPAKRTQPVKKEKKKQDIKPEYMSQEPAIFYDDDRDELTDDELAEELHAMREKERNAGK